MTRLDADFWSKARRARDTLVKLYIFHPDVTLIDIGYPPKQDGVPETMVLRIHVKKRRINSKSRDGTSFPTSVDGIPVVVIPGDYDLSSDSLPENE